MPYPLTVDAQAKINRRDDVALTLLVELIVGDKVFKYSKLALFGAKKGLRVNSNVLELLNSAGQTGSLPINIIDKDDEMRQLIMNENIMKCPVNVWVIFEDLTWDDRILVFSGKAETPFKWNENTRTVSFNVLPYGLDGKIPAPIVFGDMPGVNVKHELDGLRAVTPLYCYATGKRRRDKMNTVTYNNYFYVNMDMPDNMVNQGFDPETNAPLGPFYSLIVDKVFVSGYFKTKRMFKCAYGVNMGWPHDIGDDAYTVVDRKEKDKDYESTNTFWVRPNPGGDEYTGKYLDLNMNYTYKIFKADEPPSGMELENLFLDSTFLIYEGSDIDTKIIPEETEEQWTYRCKCSSHNQYTGKITVDKGPFTAYGQPILITPENCSFTNAYGEYPLHMTGDMYNDYAEHWTTGKDAKIEFYEESMETLISVLPSNYVLNVFDSDMNLLIPNQEYSITLTPQTTITREEITSVWCSVSSSVGPNIVDIIKYIIENYTELTFNMDDYTDLHDLHENFPVGFYYPEEVTVGACLKDICRQACLEWTIYGGEFFLKDATSRQNIPTDLTLDSSQLELGSIRWDTSRSKDLVTSLKGTWSETEYPDDEEREVELENNIDLFGEIYGTMDFPIYHAEGSIQRALTYYLDRRSNVWENLTFRNFLYSMNMYLYERVDVDFPIMGEKSGIITEFDFTVSTFSTKLKLWTGHSITGGIGFIDSSLWDGRYTLEQLDTDYLRFLRQDNILPQRDYVNDSFIPAFVPGGEVQNFYRFMQQSGIKKAEVQAIYQQAMVIKLKNLKPIPGFEEEVGIPIRGMHLLCVFPSKFMYHEFNKALKEDFDEPDEIDQVYFNRWNQSYLTKNGHHYYLTPQVRVGSEISVLFSPQGFILPMKGFSGTDDNEGYTMCNFEMVANSETFTKDDEAVIYDYDGSQV